MDKLYSTARGEFPTEVNIQAVAAARIKTSSYLSKRLDLRGKTALCFVNSPDDYAHTAFSISRNGAGRTLGVHVADVCEYVCEGSPLDLEAKKRCATVSDGFTKSEMLPDRIVSDICNLANQADKLTLSFLLDIGADGDIISVNLEESVIRTAQNCVYSELEDLVHALDSSSVMLLRKKYANYLPSILEMYELAAVFTNARKGRNVPDWLNSRRVYERNEDGKITSYRTVDEPDIRAMIKEIGYFVSNVVGEYMAEKKLPVIYIGQAPGPVHIIEYLESLLGIEPHTDNVSSRAVTVTEQAMGSPYYRFICRLLGGGLPAAEFSDAPIHNILCGTDTIVSFFRPATHYTDLLSLRALKAIISANGDIKNININRRRKEMREAAETANVAERYQFSATRAFMNDSALEYLENSNECCFEGTPLKRDKSGSVPVLLDCGCYAVVPSEYANGFDFDAGMSYRFEIIALGTDEESCVVRPCV